MRIWLAVLLSLAMLTACAPSPEDTAACRKQFTDLQQLLAKDGNPGRKGFTPKMAARWDALDAELGRLGKSATGDACPDRLDAMKAEMTDLDSVLHKVDDYDVARITQRAQAKLDRTAKKQGAAYATDYALQTVLRTMRERGADAEEYLAPYVEAADAVKPDDTAGRASAMVALYNAAANSAAFADFKEAVDTVENYDFDRE